MISVEMKKGELVGLLTNCAMAWWHTGNPVRVSVHDVPDPAPGKAKPYGVYAAAAHEGHEGWVPVGTEHNAAAFAVGTIRRWFDQAGHRSYPTARSLLACANGYRTRAAETRPDTTVCHLPPSTS